MPPTANSIDMLPLPHHLDPRRPYSLTRAIRKAAEHGGGRYSGNLDGLEAEVSAEIRSRVGFAPMGFFVPLDVPVRTTRALDTTVGAGSVLTRTVIAQLIDVLRSKMIVARLGGQFPMSGRGLLALPKKSATSAVTWVAESAPVPAESNLSILSTVPFTPHSASCFTDVTRRLIDEQPAALDVVIDDIASSLAHDLDRVALNGQGGQEPTGLLLNGSVPVVAGGVDGAAPSWNALVSLEKALANSNADMGMLGMATTPNGRSKLRRTEIVTSTGRMVWKNDQSVMGYRAEVSTNLPSTLTKGLGTNLSALILGNWSDLIVPTWAFVDVLVNPYTLGSAGTVRIHAYLDCDVNIRHAESFVIINDMVTA